MQSERTNERSVTPPARASLGNRRVAMRLIRHPDQGMVLVYEREPSFTDTSPRTLIFESGTSCTRLFQYPSEWRRLSDEELLALPSRP